MATTVTMPKLGLTMTEGTIERWLKQEGDPVQMGEPLVEIITEKIDFQYEAPAGGVLRKILHHEGETVAVTTPIAMIASAEESLPDLKPTMKETPHEVHVSTGPPKEAMKSEERIFASPLARRIALEKGIDLKSLKGSGPLGRIVKEDVLAWAEAPRVKEEITLPPARVTQGKSIPLKGIRKIIAERMAESFRNIPHIYLSLEVDMTRCLALYEELKGEVEKRVKTKLTVTGILVKTIASALRDHPLINSRIEGDQILLLEDINIGVAIALEGGLIVPVIHQADRASLAEIAVRLRDLTQRAREGKLTLPEVAGGTFTLSNMGMLGIDKFNAIINPPECSILGVGRTVDKPVVHGGEIRIRPMAWFNLSSDHRIADGAAAAGFLTQIKALIESPTFLLV
jgi:pyruvate dehydrogenase E2 component (dihydrolipoamide acetyltransferase)